LSELVTDAETVLGLNSGFRKRTLLCIDGGGGHDANINWMLPHDYPLPNNVKEFAVKDTPSFPGGRASNLFCCANVCKRL
jgi:hypothetical protein